MYHATARSLNISDIENVLDTTYWKPSDYYYLSGYNCYSGRIQYFTNRYYPYIFSLEEYGTLNDWGWSNGIDRSTQTTYYLSTYLQAEESIMVFETVWGLYSPSTKNFTKDEYLDLIFHNSSGDNISYWLASRGFRLYTEDTCRFEVAEINDGIVGSGQIYISDNSTHWLAFAIRPLVEIDLSYVDIEFGNSGTYEDPLTLNLKN